MASLRILISENNDTASYLLKEELVGEGYKADIVNSGKKTLEQIQKKNYDILLLNMELAEQNGIRVLTEVSEHNPSLKIIVIASKQNVREAITSLNHGAYDFILRPYERGQLKLAVERASLHKELELKNKVNSARLNLRHSEAIIGECDEIKNMLQSAELTSQLNGNIIIYGEPGTGKKLLAEYIYKNSDRANKFFLPIDCSRISDQILERDLFGYEKEMSLDSKTSQQGVLELLDGGILLLNEISEVGFTLQSKLLHFIETGEFRRIGGVVNLNSSIKIIATTSKDLKEEVEKKNFRQDLYNRLNGIVLNVPPLRDRGGDIIMLSEFFLQRRSTVRSTKKLASDTKVELLRYDFPGNVSELKYIIERAFFLAEGDTIQPQDLRIPRELNNYSNFIGDSGKMLTIEEMEKSHIKAALEYYNWNRENTAHALGISIKTLYSKIRNYKLM